MPRRCLLILSIVVGLALAIGVLLARDRPLDRSILLQRLEAYLDSNPHPARVRQALRTYFSLLEKSGASESDLRALATHSTPQIRDMAQARLRQLALMSEPVELRFTAMDGRIVDLQELRGKIVLLEFWAAWCPTCMRELPNLKSVHDKYHDRGFEIVGIALDDAQDRQMVMALLKKERLQWPQYFPGDGHYTSSEISRRFGVTGIPATFLLDRRGMIADVNVRGDRLEPAVRRLLRR